MTIHSEPHPLAGATVTVACADREPEPFRVEDWWDRVAGVPWGLANGNPAAMSYAMRSAFAGLPCDDQVLYGKTNDGLGRIVHVSEVRTQEIS